jgi:hypothetical protein
MNAVRIVFVTTVLAINFALQGGMLWWIYQFVVLPSVHSVEEIYQKYHAEVFSADGTYSPDLWKTWDPEYKDELCNIAFSSYPFMFAVLSLWSYTMLIEIRKTDRFQREVGGVGTCTELHDMVDPDTAHIMNLTSPIAWLLYLLIIVPKQLIGYGLLLIGCVWLMATDSFSDLILNAVALEFVVNIDNLLFEAAMPASIISKVVETKFLAKEGKQTPEQKNKKVADGYKRSIFYFFLVPTLVFSLMGYGQMVPYVGIFPNYANDAFCPVYQAKATKRVCLPGQDCFPFGVGVGQ